MKKVVKLERIVAGVRSLQSKVFCLLLINVIFKKLVSVIHGTILTMSIES